MPNNSYVLNRVVRSFNRPNNTTAYSAFTVVSDTTPFPLIIPAPVSDRPFFIRRLVIQASPGVAAALGITVNIYNSDPSALMTFNDGSFLNQTAAGAAGLLESRTVANLPAQTQLSSVDIPLAANYSLFCPSGVWALAIEVNAAYTPSALQKFSALVTTEYGN